MSGSTIQIIYDPDGTNEDITQDVMVAPTYFNTLAGSEPGDFSLEVKDVNQTHSFVTGKRLVLWVDGLPLWGGYIFGVTRTWALPVVDTTVIANVKTRIWKLRGLDYNVLFDRRFLRNTSDYKHMLPDIDSNRYDGDLIRDELTSGLGGNGGPYLDLPSDLNTYDYVDDVVPPLDPLAEGNTGVGSWPEQGTSWRTVMEGFILISGAVCYILPLDDDPYTMALHYHSLESLEPDWSFSDQPNRVTTFGFREGTFDEDGEPIRNDALVWGGSAWSGDGETVFWREENTDSETEHGRWQVAEAHFGENWYKLLSGVKARAKTIVNGAPGEVPGEGPRGLWASQWNVELVWFSKDVPLISGSRQHLIPGQVVTITLHTFGEDAMTPLVLALPLRSVRMSFPTLDPNGDAYVRFEGKLSLQLSDPKTLWTYLRKTQSARRRTARSVVATANSASPSASYGAIYSDEPIPATDGATTTFTLDPNTFAYIPGTTEVYLNGLLQLPGTDYTESDPSAGEIVFTSAPDGADELWIRCRLA